MSQYEQRSGTGLVHGISIKSTTTGQTIDISDLVIETSYYESLDQPSASITLSIVDGIGLRSSLPIIGGETITFSFSDSERNSRRITGSMQVYKLTSKTRINPGADGYEIFAASPEMLRDQYTIISNSQESLNVADMAKKIFDDNVASISNKRLVTLEQTEGTFDSIFPRVSPFTALNYLADEAKSQDIRSTSNYFFFENSQGYNFASFQYLMRQPVKKTFYYLENKIAGDRAFERNRIVSMQEDVGFDILEGVSSGQFGTQVLSIDPVAKRFRTSTYLYNRDFASYDHSSSNPKLSPQSSQTFGSSISREKFIVSNSYRGTIPFVTERDSDSQNVFRRRQEFLAAETASKAELMSHVTKILVHGDSNLSVGDTIEIRIPQSGESSLRRRQTDGFSGGKYLIVALAHRVGPRGLRYGTALECVKDSYSQPVDGR
jgi:hypothetical protein